MPITKGCMQLVEEASRKIQTLSLEEAIRKHGDPDVLFVDLRDVREDDRRISQDCERGIAARFIPKYKKNRSDG